MAVKRTRIRRPSLKTSLKEKAHHRPIVHLDEPFTVKDKQDVGNFLRLHPGIVPVLQGLPTLVHKIYPDYKDIDINIVRDDSEDAFLSATIRFAANSLEPYWNAYQTALIPETLHWGNETNFHLNVSIGLC
jgi:hypothetical protein